MRHLIYIRTKILKNYLGSTGKFGYSYAGPFKGDEPVSHAADAEATLQQLKSLAIIRNWIVSSALQNDSSEEKSVQVLDDAERFATDLATDSTESSAK